MVSRRRRPPQKELQLLPGSYIRGRRAKLPKPKTMAHIIGGHRRSTRGRSRPAGAVDALLLLRRRRPRYRCQKQNKKKPWVYPRS